VEGEGVSSVSDGGDSDDTASRRPPTPGFFAGVNSLPLSSQLPPTSCRLGSIFCDFFLFFGVGGKRPFHFQEKKKISSAVLV
jgi:hypothetical protein